MGADVNADAPGRKLSNMRASRVPERGVRLSSDSHTAPPRWPASAWTLEPPGFKLHALHALQAGGRLVSHLAYCGVHEGLYPFHDGQLID